MEIEESNINAVNKIVPAPTAAPAPVPGGPPASVPAGPPALAPAGPLAPAVAAALAPAFAHLQGQRRRGTRAGARIQQERFMEFLHKMSSAHYNWGLRRSRKY
ncbi:cyclin-dependent kinase inhibitor 1C-like [Odontomachus brunneus]|uniref:cyclin-dependent kinase inhibitor 1C-like n=1 Tax=Odontomachus brunneus TaxID=486640 RepID=UPI0013F24ECD|nr:cyclin-dependent kinase inhibitor 1C-like [Odontomachus brunneus]